MNNIWREVFDILSPYSFHLKCGSAHDARRRLSAASKFERALSSNPHIPKGVARSIEDRIRIFS